MKNKMIMLAALISAIVVGGCGASNVATSGGDVVVTDNRTKDTEEVEVVDNRTASEENNATFSESDFDVKTYLYENTIGDTLYFVGITNNSQATVEVSGSATAKDATGNAIGVDDMSIDIIGPGETTMGYFYFSDVKDIASVDYELKYDRETYYKPIINNLKVEQTLNDKNLTVALTNNGDINAQFVEAYALFMDADNNVLSYNSGYVVDDDSEIKPGATLSEQLDCYQGGYDHVELYITGRSDGSASEVVSSSSVQFDTEEYIFENSFGTTYYFVVMTNNTNETYKVSSNGTALDANGNVLGADDMTVDVIGPGETTMEYFFFDNVSGVDHVDYQLNYSDSYYKPVINNLAVEQNINNKNVVVSVTNNGSYAAEFVQAYALFFDSNNNVVRFDSTYVTDDDSEIKPGATLSKQLDSYNAFDTVNVYFTGRAH